MGTDIFAELKGNGKAQPVFEGLQARAELRETLAITTITQSYRNAGTKNIEAVYTFPLPLDAVLLDLEITLGDKTLKGTVLPKNKAEERYENAITDGDAPVMLQNVQPGIYTMNVGNLLPDEKVQITFRYAMFQCWQGDTLRYHLPTAIAPRYGSAVKAGLEPHQEPQTSLQADNLFSFQMNITGNMSSRLIESPSHEITINHVADSRESIVNLANSTAYMDRDLIITVKNTCTQVVSAVVERDGDEYLLWGSFKPHFGLSDDSSPRSIKIVVDCSGSMGGDSIVQAREALLRVLDELRPQDWFNIVTFGSTATSLFNTQKRADEESISYARGFLKNMDANMGGTETGGALEMAVRLRSPDNIQQDVLLITDGEIWGWEQVVAKAVKSKHRFFTVGVGSAVSEAFVRNLADRTGGACELVSPRENMADRIHRHFKRISTPRSRGTEIKWPSNPLRVFPETLPCIFDGDTVNIFAWFSEPPTGEVQLQVSLPNCSTQVQTATIEPFAAENDCDTISRMVAAYQLMEISDENAGQSLAVKYQLMSKWTNYIAVVERTEEEKADTLPELETVEQMQAAGWGGSGSVMYSASQMDRPTFIRDRASSSSTMIRKSISFIGDEDIYDVPTFLRKSVDSPATFKSLSTIAPAPSPQEGSQFMNDEPFDSIESVIEFLNGIISSGMKPTTIEELRLPADIRSILDALEDDIGDEESLVIIFLHYLTTIYGEQFTRQAKRVINKAYKGLLIGAPLVSLIEERLFICNEWVELGKKESGSSVSLIR